MIRGSGVPNTKKRPKRVENRDKNGALNIFSSHTQCIKLVNKKLSYMVHSKNNEPL